MKKSIVCIIVICFFSAAPCFSETSVSLRLAPALELPFELPQFSTIMGINASLDWAFINFNKFNIGLSAGGTVAIVPVQVGEPLILYEGNAGPFLRFRPFDRFSIRAGINAGIYQFTWGDVTGLKLTASASIGFEYHLFPFISIFAGGAYSFRVFTEGSPMASLSATVGIVLNLSELMNSRIRVNVEKSKQYRIFPVSWAWYENNPVAEVTITNEEPNTITDVRLSFFLDSYMGQPWTFAHLPRLAPGSSVEVPVTALFNEVMLSLTENVNANGIIQLQYRSLGSLKETILPIQMPIFHRNTLSWDDDRRAAAFVSPRDGSARIFARYVQNAVDLYYRSSSNVPSFRNAPANVRYAAAMFEALRLYGISYVVVPTLSFVNMRADESALDNVSYPYETLYFRGGDCTYISILFCSLLEALNIETAFITIPGHLYMAFEVGDNNWLAGSREIIELNGKRWLPVEITVPEEGFFRAWRIGARQWRNAGEEAELFPIRECWEVYPAVTVTVSIDYPPEMPYAEDIVEAMEREIRNIR
ncbi:MAG: transglutaminase-like domain-containing protein [Treponema sp.]|nr:transglutaminase-like domain-containing protein [Treponema sp.]